MRVTIELCAGSNHRHTVTQKDLQKNIDAMEKAIDGKPLSGSDITLLMDTRSILEGIKEALKGG